MSDRPDSSDVTLAELGEPYLEASRATNAASTVERKRGILRHLCAAFGDRTLDELGPADVERYRWARRRQVSGGCVNRELATLSHLFNWARRLGHCEHNPVREVPRFPENKDAWLTLTPEQAERLLAACRRSDPRAWYLHAGSLAVERLAPRRHPPVLPHRPAPRTWR